MGKTGKMAKQKNVALRLSKCLNSKEKFCKTFFLTSALLLYVRRFRNHKKITCQLLKLKFAFITFIRNTLSLISSLYSLNNMAFHIRRHSQILQDIFNKQSYTIFEKPGFATKASRKNIVINLSINRRVKMLG